MLVSSTNLFLALRLCLVLVGVTLGNTYDVSIFHLALGLHLQLLFALVNMITKAMQTRPRTQGSSMRVKTLTSSEISTMHFAHCFMFYNIPFIFHWVKRKINIIKSFLVHFPFFSLKGLASER